MGNDLLNFIGKISNKELFSPVMQSQLEFGVNLTEGDKLDKDIALKYMKEAIKECLDATDDWRQFHKNLVNTANDEFETVDFSGIVDLAVLENKVFNAKKSENLQAIDTSMRQILTKVEGSKDEGWYYQIYAQLLNSIDSSRASDIQIKAKELNSSLLRPLTFTKGKKVLNYGNQISQFKANIKEFDRGTDIVIHVNTILSSLKYSPDMLYKKFEESVQKIGEFLGFNSSRPDSEYNDGPDNFWRTETYDFVIECKNNSINNISRDEANQMTASLRWYKELYTENERMIGVILHNSNRVAKDAHINDEFKVIDSEKLDLIKVNLRKLSNELSHKAPDMWSDSELEMLLRKYAFTEKTFLTRYIRNIRN
jgi:hypothetical protein